MVEVKLGYKTVDLPYTIRVRDVTEEMFHELVDEDTRAELLDGVLIVHSPATWQHDDVSGFIRGLARPYARARKLGVVLGPDTLVHLATCRKFAPNAFFVRQKRVPRPRPKEFRGAPDWVMEVLSSNRQDDLEDKRPAYREAGVEEIWFVDLENQAVIVDRKRGPRYVEKVVTKGRLSSKVLEGFWLDVSWLWTDSLPDDLACLRAILGET